MGKIIDIKKLTAKRGGLGTQALEAIREKLKFGVYGVKTISNEILDFESDMDALASFIDKQEAQGFIAARNIWSEKKYAGYILTEWDSNTVTLLVRVPEGWVEQPLELDIK